MPDSAPIVPRWFNATLDWKALGSVIVTVVGLSYFGVTSWQDSKAQLSETRQAILTLTQKFEDSMSKRDDRLTTTERELRAKIESSVEVGRRERQILETRIITLESRQDNDDKRSREDAVAMATLREQVSSVLATVNSLRDMLITYSDRNGSIPSGAFSTLSGSRRPQNK